MQPNVIKFISVDGLTRFEDWNRPTSPDQVIRRVGVAWTGCMEEAFDLDKAPQYSRVHKREYHLYDHYVDEINGNRVFVYKERP